MKAAELFVRCLENEGVRFVFGLPGEENLDLLEALRQSDIEFVLTRHEQHAAFMAATYGRLTGRAGVCLSTLGPGATNLLTGVAHAQLGGMPLVAITGQKPMVDNDQGLFQLVDVVGTFEPLTRWNARIEDASRIPRHIRHAFSVAEGLEPGAVHLELPEDIAAVDVPDARPLPRIETVHPVASREAVSEAARFVREASTPILIVGSGANRSAQQLADFVSSTGIHCVSTQMAKGVLPEDHDRSLLCLAVHDQDYVHAAVDAADLVITVGYNIVEYPPSVWNADGDKTILHIDQHAAEPDVRYGPCYELIGEIGASLAALAKELEEHRVDDPRFVQLGRFMRERLWAEPTGGVASPANIVAAVRGVLDPQDVVCLDNGLYKLWFARNYPTFAPMTLLLDNALATMGAGLGSAMAAKLVHPERRALAVCGDGGFLMNSQDLETVARLGMDVVVLVLEDHEYGFIQHKQRNDGFEKFGVQFGNPDFVRYAEAHGLRGYRVGDAGAETLTAALEAAFAEPGGALVACPIEYGERFQPDEETRAAIREIMAG